MSGKARQVLILISPELHTTERTALLESLALFITSVPSNGILRVAVDGIDGAGKTMLADELAAKIRQSHMPVIRASVDDFHHPRDVRYRRGRTSPDGFYLDSYDYSAFRRYLIDPLSPGGSGRYRTAIFDHIADSPVPVVEQSALPESVLLVDGIFLHRPELRDAWDISLFLYIDFEQSISRIARRNPDLYSPYPNAASNLRYTGGQKRYLLECDPMAQATIAIDNTDLGNPKLLAAPPHYPGGNL